MESHLVRGPLLTKHYLQKFQKEIEEKYGLQLENYFDFHRWSCENYPKFWKEVWDHLDIICSRTYDEVVDETADFADVPEWFRGSKLNYAENILRYPDDDHVAIIVTGEEKRTPEYVTFGQLRADVALLSSAFRNAGIQHEDVVACFISNKKEAIVALLAAAAVGAIFSAVNPLMGANGIVSRFEQLSPKVLFTTDRFVYNAEERNVLEVLPKIVRDLQTLTHVIIVSSKEESLEKDISFIPKSQFLPEFLKMGLTTDGDIPPQKFDQLSFSHPLIVTYTSGTTGPPKGIVHSAGAALLVPLSYSSIHFNLTNTDVALTMYLTGWVTWNFFVDVLALGTTLVLYEGMPFFWSETYFWDLVDEYKVTFAFLPPSVLDEMEKRNYVPGKHNSLKTLDTLISGSCRIKDHTYDFVYQKIKPDVFFSEVFGSTEFMSVFAGLNYDLPVYKGQMQVLPLGIEICCYNEEGKPVLDEQGELVITKPFPSMPLYFWNDELKEKYHATFFSMFPRVWRHGDVCAISSKTGGMTIFRRSDETIKQRGARFGSAEIYNVMNNIEEVLDSLCVSKLTAKGDEIAFLFVSMKEGHCFNAQLVRKIRDLIQSELSFRHVPEIILSAPTIPYNLNGKKMEVLVKKILAGAQVNKENVSNPECLSYYCGISRMDV